MGELYRSVTIFDEALKSYMTNTHELNEGPLQHTTQLYHSLKT